MNTKRYKNKVYTLSKAQIKTLTAELKSRKVHQCWYLFFLIGLVTGARISEILSLRRSDIRESSKSEYIAELRNTKNGNFRPAYLPSKLAKKLLSYCCSARRRYIDGGEVTPNERSYLIPHARFSLNTFLRRLSVKLGWDRITPHCLRRTFASQLVEKGFALNHLQRLLGHENLQTTNAYTQTFNVENPLKFLLN